VAAAVKDGAAAVVDMQARVMCSITVCVLLLLKGSISMQ
jgi:hypothetical protein